MLKRILVTGGGITALFLLATITATPASARCGLFNLQFRDDAYCQSLGAQPGTDPYIQRRMYLMESRRQGIQS